MPMILLHAPVELDTGGCPVALAIGVFDGVHLGHQEVIRRAQVAAARTGGLVVVATFDRHPNAVVAPERVPPAILPTALRLRVLAELGVEATWLIRFDEAFSRQTGEEFVRRVAAGFGRVTCICVGRDFQFGWRRSGNVALLERLGVELGFGVEAVPPLSLAGRTLSSTGIRELIQQGALEEVARWLGRPYLIAGTVVRGDRLGRALRYATANVEITGLQLPPSGVYAAHAREPGGRWEPAVMNLGVRPTIGSVDATPRLEVHLLDRQPELYGRELEVWPVRRLRDEMRFPSREALQAQIARDVAAARGLLQGGAGWGDR